MMFKSRCYNGGKRHKLVACYQEVPREPNAGLTLRGMDVDDMKRLLFVKKYTGHICKWCGFTVRRNVPTREEE